MALNPAIILGGNQPNILAAIDAGQQAGERGNQIREQNALASLYQTQGAGIAAGDRNALNALAAIDPAASLQIQGARQDMAAQQQRMDMLTREEQRAIQDQAARLSAAERAAEAQRIEQGVAMGLGAQSPEQWDSIMSQMAPDLVGQFDNRQMLANRFMSIADVLKRQDEMSKPADLGDRFKVVGSSIFDLAAPGGPAPVGQGAMPEETIFGPDGNPIIQRGGPGSSAKFTEGQSKDNVYTTRAEGALRLLDSVGAENLADRSGRIGEALGGVTLGLSRQLTQSDDFQRAQQAGEEFLQAILRKDTGAAITEGEQVLYGQTYLPRPGDSPAVIEAKRQARIRAVEAIRSGMSAQQQVVVDQALINSALRSGQVPTQPQQGEPMSQGSNPADVRPRLGTVEDGFRYVGGDPANPASWEQVQ